MTTTSVPHQHGARATHSLWRYGPIAIAAAAAATALVAATARAADVPLTIDGEQIPVAGVVTMTVLACSIGLLLAGALLVRLPAGGEKDVLRGAELLPEVVVALPSGAGHGLPAVHQRPHRSARRTPLGRGRQLLRLLDELLLGRAGLAPLGV